MPKQTFILLIILALVTLPFAIFAAPPTFTPTVPDITPIDQQTVMLASGGVVYALYKIRNTLNNKK